MMVAVAEILNVMNNVYGKDISVYERSFLLKSVEKRLAALNGISNKQYAGVLAEDENEAYALFSSLTICYSDFFRNPLTFALLEQLILPRLIDEKSPNSEIRIWSAGCAAGQETYSIAMVLDELIRRKEKATNFRVFGTDISENSLTKARKGVFNRLELGNVNLGRMSNYFSQRGENYTISDNLKDSIDFSFDDLLDSNSISPAASIFGDFDLICCSNLLFYYNAEIRQAILKKLYLSLSRKGYLVTGEAEREIVAKYRFRPVYPPAAVFQKIG